MADAWGGAFGASWGQSWGYTASVSTGTSGGRGGRIITWRPEPIKKKKKKRKEEEVVAIERIVQKPLVQIDLASLSLALHAALASEAPDYASIIFEAKRRAEEARIKAENDRLLALAAEEKARLEAYAAEQERIRLEQIARRKEMFAKKRQKNQQILKWLMKDDLPWL